MHTQQARLLAAAIAYDRGDARRIQHFIKVHGLCAAIGTLEGLDDETQFVLETAAILHDIGIHQAEVVHHNGHGKYQEMEGPAVAEQIMRDLGGYTETQIERVKFLIAHHHTPAQVDGPDYQILLEADYLVNAYEGSKAAGVPGARKRLFRTETGKKFLDDMFAPGAYQPPADLP